MRARGSNMSGRPAIASAVAAHVMTPIAADALWSGRLLSRGTRIVAFQR